MQSRLEEQRIRAKIEISDYINHGLNEDYIASKLENWVAWHPNDLTRYTDNEELIAILNKIGDRKLNDEVSSRYFFTENIFVLFMEINQSGSDINYEFAYAIKERIQDGSEILDTEINRVFLEAYDEYLKVRNIDMKFLLRGLKYSQRISELKEKQIKQYTK